MVFLDRLEANMYRSPRREAWEPRKRKELPGQICNIDGSLQMALEEEEEKMIYKIKSLQMSSRIMMLGSLLLLGGCYWAPHQWVRPLSLARPGLLALVL
jgi:hypothetical protein